jgi:alkanesulfonate monooxygenase SsuD/methylene tetrahydromethanopterin reductase-like flavin-dependent oxidoreductase (luciferase family)
VEFGVFLNGYIPGPAAHDPECEHRALMQQAEYAVLADKHNFKYAWFGEHHGLAEYSHMSAPAVVMGMVAGQTDQIHLCTGITSLPTTKEHPVRIAERAAMLDHVTQGRFEFGTGRGAGSHEVASFNGTVITETKAMWEEVVREIPRMWERKDYTFEGEFFNVPTPHNILPKPYLAGHPPIWVAAGNPPTFAKAGSMGIGAIAFNFKPIHEMKPVIDAYKEAAEHPDEVIGQFQNNSLMLTNQVICLEDRDEARRIAMQAGSGYLVTLLHLYHDTFPKMGDGITWPEAPPHMIANEEILDLAIEAGGMLVGNPEEVAQQLQSYVATGADQVTFAFPNEGMHHEQALECIELFGSKVIPEVDTDPVHRTTRFRERAAPKFGAFGSEPQHFDIEVIPGNAMIPLGG